MAVRRQHSAASSSRTSMNPRNHWLNTSGRVSPVGSGSTTKRGGLPAHSLATCKSPWNMASGRSSSASSGAMLAADVRMVIAGPTPRLCRLCRTRSRCAAAPGVRACGVQAQHRLGEHQPDAVLQPIPETAGPMLRLVAFHRAGVHTHFPVNHAHREAAHIVGKRVERAAAGEVKPCVVPVAGQDAVADAAPVQWKPHVRAPLVHCVDLAIVIHNGNGMPAAGYNPARPVLEFINRCGPYLSLYLHSHTLPSRSESRPTIESTIMIIVDPNGAPAPAQPGD